MMETIKEEKITQFNICDEIDTNEKQIINEYYYDGIIKYLENCYNNYEFNDSLRDKYVKEFLTKYIRTIKSVRLLDLNGFHYECDILIRTLDEMIIDLAYLELNPEENYKRYDLYIDYQLYDYLVEKSKYDETDINKIGKINEIKKLHDQYDSNYDGKKSRWSGISYYDQVLKIDEKSKKGTMSFIQLYIDIYKLNCLNSHNSGIILDKIYKYLNINENIDYMYLHNINYVVLLTTLLKDVCLPDIFTSDSNIFKEFDTYLGSLQLIKKINKGN